MTSKIRSYIYKERVLRLIKNGILPQLNFVDWDVCTYSTKGKQTRKNKK